jgi:hypothetical protein
MKQANRGLLATTVGGVIFAFLFGWAFIAAFHNPTPHQVPVGIVAPAPQAQQLGGMISAHLPGGLDLHTYATPAAAEDAIKHRTVEGAFVAGPQPVLMIASAGGTATAQFLQAAFTGVAQSIHQNLQVHDVAPLPAGNSEGLVLFFLVLTTLIPSLAIGVLSSLLGKGSKAWLQGSVLIVTAVAIGALGALIAGKITGSIDGHYLAIAGIVALLSLAISASTAALARIATPLAGLAVLTFVVAGIPATGGPVGMARFVPTFFRDLAPGLPASRAIPALTNTAYFGGHDITTDIGVLGIWAVAGLVVLLLAGLLHRATPEAGQQSHATVDKSPVTS